MNLQGHLGAFKVNVHDNEIEENGLTHGQLRLDELKPEALKLKKLKLGELKECPFKSTRFKSCRFQKMSKSIRRTTRHIFVPALPVLAALFFSSLIGLSDAFLAGKMSTTELAALGFCEPIWFLLNLSMTGLGTGVAIGLASRFTRLKYSSTASTANVLPANLAEATALHHTDANEFQIFLVDSLFLSLIVGFCLMFSGFLVAHVLEQNPTWFSGTANVVARYFWICSISNVPFALMQAQCAVFRAIDKTNAVLWLWGTATLIEISLSSYIVLVATNVPTTLSGLSILAASWTLACLISAILGFAMMADLFKRFNLRNYFGFRVKHLENATYILKIAIPIATSELGQIVASFLYLQMLFDSPQPQCLEAAWATKSRIEDFFEVAPANAIALIAAPFIGRHINSRDRRAAPWSVRITVEAAVISGLFSLCAALCTPLIANKLIACLGGDLSFQTSAYSVVSLGSLAWPCFAVARILTGALEGTGRCLIPTILNLICALPVRLTLATLLKNSSLMSGLSALTISGIITQALLALIMLHLFRSTFCPAVQKK